MALGNFIFQLPNEVKTTIRKIEKILLKINLADTAFLFNSTSNNNYNNKASQTIRIPSHFKVIENARCEGGWGVGHGVGWWGPGDGGGVSDGGKVGWGGGVVGGWGVWVGWHGGFGLGVGVGGSGAWGWGD